ncbi:MAG: CocE/NonD family hydrolase [Anaerolineaceae bacterium]|nr:CocE/NonD family hydrolase [Anaerolineaceae bacterium]
MTKIDNLKRKHLKKGIGILIFLLFAICLTIWIIGLTPPRIPVTPSGEEQYQSVYVPMRDGTKIAVRISLPPDLSENGTIPAIMETTRHPTDVKDTILMNFFLKINGEVKPNLKIGHLFAEAGYAYIRVDARGSNASFGNREIEWAQEEIDDMGEIIDWIVKQPWSNGDVGAYGVSYSGNTAELAAALDHPNFKASALLYSDFDPVMHNAMPGGILNEYLIDTWSDSQKLQDANLIKDIFYGGTAPVDMDPHQDLLNQAIASRDNYDLSDTFHKVTYFDEKLTGDYTAYSIAPYAYKDEIQEAETPFYIRVGWLDAATVEGAIERYLTYSNSQVLIIGPWNHAGTQFYDPIMNKNESDISLILDQERAVVNYFNQVMADGNQLSLPEKSIQYYTMGEGEWKTTTTWPVEGFSEKQYYFISDGTLSPSMPENQRGSNQYTVDYSTTTGESNRWKTNLGAPPVIFSDRSEEDRKLLTYTSETFETDVEITGNPVVNLSLTSSTEDNAIYVYLEMVSPDGVVTYITEGQLRSLHRAENGEDLGKLRIGPNHSFKQTDGKLLNPGEQYEMRIGMYATSVLIPEGYRIRIAIAGHDASCFERIPDQEETIITIETNSISPSFITVPIKERP